MELRELLTHYGFPGDEIPIIRGTAKAALRQPGRSRSSTSASATCWTRVDATFPSPSATADKPFLMAIEDVFSIEGRGTVATGRIEQRHASKSARRSSWSASRTPPRRSCTGVEMFNKTLDEGHGRRQRRLPPAGRQARRHRARPGPGQAQFDHAAHQVRGRSLRVVARRKGGGTRRSSAATVRSFISARPTSRERPPCWVRPRCACRATMRPLDVELGKPIAMTEGSRFAIREGGKTVGSGVVTKIVA